VIIWGDEVFADFFILQLTFLNVATRDGIEPPTPAFSGR
jgi:hypothetical protein